MKAVLLSIKPKYCELIASGKKTVEVRKNRPKLETPFKCYIYCTKDSKLNFWTGKRYSYADEQSHNLFDKCGNGKVIGEFVCSNIAKGNSQLGSCMSLREISEYANGKEVYGWCISDLVIYDKPKELSEFYRKCDKFACESCGHIDYEIINDDEFEFEYEYFWETNGCIPITRPPRSWCYVESEVSE